MKWITIIALVITSYRVSANIDSSSIANYWLNETGEYIVEIYQEGKIFKGKIVWLADSLDIYQQPRRDVMNNDPQLRSRLLLGLVVLDDFIYDDGVWRKGQVYNFKNGNDYNAHLKIDNDGNLRWTGYYGILFFLGKTKVWNGVQDISKYGIE